MPPLGVKTVIEALDLRSKQLNNCPAFIFRDDDLGRNILTWQELHTLGGRFAAVLRYGDNDKDDKEVCMFYCESLC